MLDFKMASQEEIAKALAQRLRAHRLTKNLKQGDLAARAGISVGTVKNLESSGQASIETLIRIVIALDLTQDLNTLFETKARSIAQMEQMEFPVRQRAR
ncbi:MAG: helix-turn-helix transcriptional regulator [Deltaproteobacteria bacterium]|nr:helix-turn-helix transcriptional regulator [Deltaproteobacteria bacterium]